MCFAASHIIMPSSSIFYHDSNQNSTGSLVEVTYCIQTLKAASCCSVQSSVPHLRNRDCRRLHAPSSEPML